MRIIAIVGMAGSGKSEVARILENNSYRRIRFGDITDQEILKKGLTLNEENERIVREQIRGIHGMGAYAKLNIPKIDAALNISNVVLDGLYSWEEYQILKNYYKDKLNVLAIYSSPDTRYYRLSRRKIRPLTFQDAAARDKAEIENINKGGPIAMSDYTIINESTTEYLEKEIIKFVRRII